jgi:hypothetical protein
MKLPKKRSGNRSESKPSLGHDRRQLPALNNVSPSHRSASFSFGMEGMPPTSPGAPTGFRFRAVERTAATCSAPGGPHVTAQARQPLGHKTGTSRGGHFDNRDGAASYKSTVRRAGPQTRECRDGRTCRPIHGSERCDSVPPQERSHRIRSGRGGGVEVGLAPTRSAAERRDRGSDSDCRALGLPTRLPAY